MIEESIILLERIAFCKGMVVGVLLFAITLLITKFVLKGDEVK